MLRHEFQNAPVPPETLAHVNRMFDKWEIDLGCAEILWFESWFAEGKRFVHFKAKINGNIFWLGTEGYLDG